VSPPSRTQPAGGPVRPRDAASLVIWRQGAKGIEVLMGRRPSKMAFAPDAWVFPGGRVDPHDSLAKPAHGLDRHTFAALMRDGTPTAVRARALAIAAVRETYEETGLLVAAPGDIGSAKGATWRQFQEQGLAPDLSGLSYLMRAITPTLSPIRFHARFFLLPAGKTSGDLAGSGELIDLDFIDIRAARERPMIDVTEFALDETLRRLAEPARAGATPLFAYRRNQPAIRRPQTGPR